jgi:DNA-binding NarL/FixJ family response regulator
MVSPDCEIAITRLSGPTIGSRYRNSLASSTSTGIRVQCSIAYLATIPACAAVPHAMTTTLLTSRRTHGAQRRHRRDRHGTRCRHAGPPPAPGGVGVNDGRRLRVVLVDDHALVRSGLRAELGDGVDVVGEAADVDEAVRVVTAQQPDVVLLDVHLPGGDGRAVLDACAESAPATRFLAISVSDAPADVVSVVRGGARGYVTKAISGEDLRAAVERIAAGDAVFSPRLAGFVLDAFAAGATDTSADPAEGEPDDLDRLTPREREVMRYIARGYTYRETAAELFLSVKTIETHVSAVLRKLQLSNRRELERWASARRLT